MSSERHPSSGPADPAPATTSASRSPAAPLLHGLFTDLGPTLVAYYGLRAVGADTWVSMLGATIVSGLQTLYTAIRRGRLNAFSALMLVVFGVGFALTFLTGDPRLNILKDSAVTAGVGLLFLVTTLFGRPFIMQAAKAWSPDEAADIDRAWETDPAVRHGYRLTSMVWGFGLLGEATLRVVLTFLLPVDVMVGLSNVLWIVAVLLLVGWTNWAVARRRKAAAERRARDLGSAGPSSGSATEQFPVQAG